METSAPQVWQRGDWARLIRLFSMGATVAYAPLGMVTARGEPELGAAVAAVVAGIAFHLFAFPLNDVIDLPIDRTNARRADGPLVRRLVRPGTMLTLALAQLPIMGAVLWLGGAGGAAFAWWSMAVVALGGYDLVSKRLIVPFAADALQGVGFAALVVAGGHWVGSPGAVTWLVAAYVVIYIAQINAVHGGLRDMANDVAHGARTTPVLLGCSVDAAGVPVVSPAMAVFAIMTELAQVALVVGVLLAVSPEPALWWVAPTAALVMRLVAVRIGWGAYTARADRSRMMARGVWHLFWSLLAIVVAPWGAAPWWLAALVLAVFLGPPGWFARLTR